MHKRAMNGVIFPVAKILDENTIYCLKWVSVSEVQRAFTDLMIVFVIVEGKRIIE